MIHRGDLQQEGCCTSLTMFMAFFSCLVRVLSSYEVSLEVSLLFVCKRLHYYVCCTGITGAVDYGQGKAVRCRKAFVVKHVSCSTWEAV